MTWSTGFEWIAIAVVLLGAFWFVTRVGEQSIERIVRMLKPLFKLVKDNLWQTLFVLELAMAFAIIVVFLTSHGIHAVGELKNVFEGKGEGLAQVVCYVMFMLLLVVLLVVLFWLSKGCLHSASEMPPQRGQPRNRAGRSVSRGN